MSKRSGRRMSWRYRQNRPQVLAASDLCWLCGHGGASTVDHVTPEKAWPRDELGRLLPGFDELPNLRPAHGTMGTKALNRCPTCGQLCNQSKRDRRIVSRRSRVW